MPPPGSGKGQSFVHDPKIAALPEVKASIKLRFQNRAGQTMVVIRSLQLTQKKSTLQFKTLDGVIKTNHPETGERKSISHKCTELDKQVSVRALSPPPPTPPLGLPGPGPGLGLRLSTAAALPLHQLRSGWSRLSVGSERAPVVWTRAS